MAWRSSFSGWQGFSLRCGPKVTEPCDRHVLASCARRHELTADVEVTMFGQSAFFVSIIFREDVKNNV